MTQEPQKSNTVLIVIAIIGVIGTIIASAIGAFGSYNTEKLRQEAELTRIAFVALTTQTAEAKLTPPTYTQVATDPVATDEPTLTKVSSSPTSTPMLGVGSIWIRPADGMTMMYVPAGEFVMGSNNGDENEKPAHTVYLDAYWIDRTEVTNAMYAMCVQAGGCQPPFQDSSYYNNTEYANHPVRPLNLDEAITYCKWAEVRLPTEAEWEKAARGTDGRIYPWGNKEPSCAIANIDGCMGGTSVVGSYPAGISPYGVLDMIGNVWEWVADWYSDTYYANSPDKNPQGPSSGQYHLVRGGSWFGLGYSTSSRLMYDDSLTRIARGFRCVSSLP